MATKKQTPQLITEDDVLAFYDETEEKSRVEALRGNYALQPEDVWALINQQKGYCPICAMPLYFEAGMGRGIAIDHEGESGQGRVRGVLHFLCNRNLLGVLEAAYRDPDCDHENNVAHGYLDNPPAKNVKVGDSNLYDEKIEDRKKRGRPGRICQREGCEKTIPATKPLTTKYCDPTCKQKAAKARWWAERRENLPDRECLQCEDPIDDDAHLHTKYCSPKCREEAYNERRRDAYHERRRKNN